ncbi:MAG TPA: methyltransferase domain-containing protein [Pyrinomonadaceae bacterium]|nr:methyltransferase domain-containing protein [Pyrinomonadaceae bacterium]
MNWQRKAQIQNLIARLPLSNTLYYAMQRTAGSLRAGRTNPVEYFDAARRAVGWIRSTGRDVEGMRFLEVGTGRNVNLPTALWLCGAASVTTVDLNPYLSSALVFESNEYVRQHEGEILKAFGAESERPQFRERLAQLLTFKGNLDALLRLMNVRYLPRADAARLPLADASIDAHVSFAVFEHIPARDLERILREARRVLAAEGLLVHIIDPSDHFSHDDQSITAINFLQFGEREWERLAGNQFMYHNRLRAFEYLELFERAGVRIIEQKQTVDEPSLSALKNGFPLHAEFRHIPVEQLAVRSLNVLATFAPVAPEVDMMSGGEGRG